jgi:hypothetical protein
MSSQRPQGGGILPSKTLKSLDELIDRLNNNANVNMNSNIHANIPILALLIGTNEGIPLSRSYGTIHNPQQTVTTISDEVLSSIETIWATLPSATPPHVKNTMNMHRRGNTGAPGSAENKNNENKEPPHPLLSHLGLGDTVRTAMAFYDHVTLIHVHIAPLVVTILASPGPNTNLGAIQSIAVPFLKELLEPVKNALLGVANGGAMNMGAGAAVVGAGHNKKTMGGMKHDHAALGYFHG